MGVQNSQLNFGMESILKKNILMSKSDKYNYVTIQNAFV